MGVGGVGGPRVPTGPTGPSGADGAGKAEKAVTPDRGEIGKSAEGGISAEKMQSNAEAVAADSRQTAFTRELAADVAAGGAYAGTEVPEDPAVMRSIINFNK